jgi:hypothetical protein
VETATPTVLVEPVVPVKPMVRKSGQDWQAHQLEGQPLAILLAMSCSR